VNQAVLADLNPEQVEVEICLAEELAQRRGLTSELDEMWAYVARKSNPRWLWHAIDHHTGKVLAYVFGRRKDHVFLKLKALLEPFGIAKYCTDGWGAYERHLDPEQHRVGKDQTQKIESKHISATRQGWSKGIGGCDASMKLCSSSSRCKSCPAKGEPARAGSKPGDGRGNKTGDAEACERVGRGSARLR
jgi:insertion element IS1 protein InsB